MSHYKIKTVLILNPDHIETLYKMCVERAGEEDSNISFTMPSYEEHRDFVRSSPYRHWALIHPEGSDEYVGQVYLTRTNEIGVYIFKQYRGQGLASAVLQHVLKYIEPLPAIPGVRPGYWVANINPKNKASIKLFKSLGFELGQQSYFLKGAVHAKT